MESEWTMFRTSMDADSMSYSLKIVGACRGGNRRICWWTPAVMEAVKLKEAFQAPGGHPKQLTGTERLKGLQHW